MNVNKSEKSAYFRHIFVDNFFPIELFSNFFNGFKISIKFCLFIPILRRISYKHFLQTSKSNADETSKKRTYFVNVSQNLIWQPSTVSENRVVKIVVPQCACSELYHKMFKNLSYQNIENIDNSEPSRPCSQSLIPSLGVFYQAF